MNIYVWVKEKTGKSNIIPDELITWAKQDINGGDRRGIANALTNAKRALHSRIDEILYTVRVRYAKGWPPRPDTEIKLKVLKCLGIQTTEIAGVLTDRRNDLEHDYILPPQKQVKADVQIAGLWLKDSKSYLRPSIVLAGLPVISFGLSVTERIKKGTVHISFSLPEKEVLFFCDAQKKLITLKSDGTFNETEYKKFNWKELTRYQKPYFYENNPKIVPSIHIANKIYKNYEQWVARTKKIRPFF